MPDEDDYRLRRPEEFRAVLRGGKRHSARHLTAVCLGNGRGAARLGLAIAKRSLPRAVDRNLIKRLTRESFRAQRPDLPAVDVVILARSGAAAQPRADLHAQLLSLWQRVRQQCAAS